ncbi:CBS domain-containing protein [Thiotrichales bacterium 19S11-10]|nr:CBS domain-containing protein [Thiotrichales bacterium 19S11-10]MCF6808341.1 CBS domain-containing protein [Thiotrichales bacterium 19S9-11]MCF6811806.1 CBS domain-containing protein [Thiotrichales bacterium 19S9-12]
MFKEFAKLELHTLPNHINYFHPQRFTDIVTTDSPALQTFTDFHVRPPVTTVSSAFAHQALEKMKTSEIRCLLVIDNNDKVIGFINSAQILGIQLTQVAQANDINQTEVTVSMLMTPISALRILNYRDLSNARVGHIARILHEHSLSHLLVYEVDHLEEVILRGMFSTTQISRQLGIDIGNNLASETIAEMSKRI